MMSNEANEYDPVELVNFPAEVGYSASASALLAGQVFNRCIFQIQQGVFLTGPLSEAQWLVDRLRNLVRGMTPANARDAVELASQQQFHELFIDLHSEQHEDILAEKWNLLNARFPPDGAFPVNVRRELLQPIFATLADIRHSVTQHLPERLKAVFRLGEHLDRGLCPNDVFLDLDGRSLANHLHCLKAESLSEGGGWGATAEVRPKVELASHSCAPGDISPRRRWRSDFLQSWQETALAPPQLDEFEVRGKVYNPEEWCGVIRNLANQALKAVLDLSCSANPPRGLADRLAVDEGARTIRFDGKEFSIQSRPAFAVLASLIRAEGEVVETPVLQGLPGCKGHIDTVVRKLPQELRSLVARMLEGGGYFLHLPGAHDSAECVEFDKAGI